MWLRHEVGITVLGLLVAFAATAWGPRLHQGRTKDDLMEASALKSERIEVLEALLLSTHRNNNALRAQLAENNLLRNKAYGQLDGVLRERTAALKECDRLEAQLTQARAEAAAELAAVQEAARIELAAAKERIRELDSGVKLANAKAAQVNELASRYALATERDAAVDRAKQAEDRIRELTLELHRAGSWP